MLLETLGGLRLAGAAFSRPKPLLLLAYLAVEGPKDRRYLSELFWPLAPTPRTNLRVAVSQLRSGAPGAIQDDGTRLSTCVPADVTKILDGPPLPRAAVIEEIYPGPFLQGLSLAGLGLELEEWVYGTRELAAEAMRDRLLDLAESLVTSGELALAAKRAEQAWRLAGAAEPTPETLERAHGLLLAGGSPHARRLEAEAVEYGVELGARGGPARAATTPGAGRAPNNLAHRTSSFEGRDLELLELSRVLDEPGSRLVTIRGHGGVGKTSLAQMAASQELNAGTFPGGVYFVELEASSSEDDVLSALAASLGVERGGDTRAALAATIGERRVLLVLDNCEHLTGHLGPVAALLASCANLTVLATSRDRLNLTGEQLFELEGLPYPEPEEAPGADTAYLNSVRLFAKRAKRVDLSFALDEENLPAVMAICRSVEGSPLAIELAAALVGVLTPREIAEELRKDQDVLSAPRLDVPARHRSLRATFEHTWRLLSREEQESLAALTVFAGGFSRSAAARVAGLTIPLLASLVDKSLVRPEGAGRYACHPLVKSYALEKLAGDEGRAAAVARGHTAYLLELAGDPGTLTKGRDPGHVYADRENFRAALRRAEREGRWGTALRLIAGVWPVWHAHGDWREARGWLEKAVAGFEQERSRDSGDAPLAGLDARRARLLAEAYRGTAVLAAAQGDFETAMRATGQGLALGRRLEDLELVGSLTNHLGVISLHRGEFLAARESLEEALALRRRGSDELGVAATLNNLGALAGRQEDVEAAARHYRESLSIYRRHGKEQAVAILLSNLGDVAHYRGELGEARAYYEQSLETNRRLASRPGIAACTVRLAAVQRGLGYLGEAKALCLQAMAAFEDLNDVEGIGGCFNEMGMILAAMGRAEPAVTAWGAMQSLLDGAGAPLPPSDARDHEKAVSAARRALGPGAFARAWTKGSSLTLEAALRSVRGAAGAAAGGALDLRAPRDPHRSR